MKDILSKKGKLGELETVALSDGCSAHILNRFPPKLKDPGSFTIPCTISNMFGAKALCDLGVNYEVDPNIHIILGRPFLSMGMALIDVHKGELTMRMNDQHVTFNLFQALKCADKTNEYQVDEKLESILRMDMAQL
ncbi:hypothetical protein GQ457_03G020080 [Hibiscus cannabinus]